MAKRKRENKVEEVLTNYGAMAVTKTDEFLDQIGPWIEKKEDNLIDCCARIVTRYDQALDVITWFIGRTFVKVARKVHDARMSFISHRKEIVKYSALTLIVMVGIVALFSSATNYEYSYNGRSLGIVKEQKDVLEILDLISEELSQEYGSNIVIDPTTDISFKPVIKYGKKIDNADEVLKRFTYMGDIQAQAYSIAINGEPLVFVESEKIAKDILEEIKELYVKESENKKYEYVGFAEDITIQTCGTTLAKISSKSAALKKIKSGGQAEKVYTVESGDTLYGICDKLDVSLKTLEKMNPKLNQNQVLHIGDKITIQQEVPLLTVETIEVATFAETIKYETEYKESSSYYVGEKVVTRAGKKGKASVTARLTKQNGKIVEREDLTVKVIQEPVSKIVVKGTKPVPPKKGTGTFIRPVNVSVYSNYGMRWGRMHYGIDFAASTGTTIRAADGGTVVKTGWSGAYGYRIVIDHGANFKTLYAHCNSISVSVGDKVYQGQKIGTVGNTGRSTGPHCHFEIFKNGVNVNPMNYL